MKILLTGATGFLGSNLLPELIRNNYTISILKRTTSKLNMLEHKYGKIDFIDMDDISNTSLLDVFFEERAFDVIIHTATSYGRKGEDQQSINYVNVLLPQKLLENCFKYGVKTFINTDTSLEKTTNNYAFYKKTFLENARAFSLAFDINFINLKLEYFYGSGDDEKKFTSFIINSCLNNIISIDLTTGEQKRDFVHISDVVSAYILILDKISNNIHIEHEFDIGSGKVISIRDFVELIHKLCNSKSILNFGAVSYRENELMESSANISLLRNYGWEPRTSLEHGLKKIIREMRGYI